MVLTFNDVASEMPTDLPKKAKYYVQLQYRDEDGIWSPGLITCCKRSKMQVVGQLRRYLWGLPIKDMEFATSYFAPDFTDGVLCLMVKEGKGRQDRRAVLFIGF